MLICQNHVDVSEGVRRCARCGTPYCPDCLVEIAGRPYCATCKNEQLLDVRSGVDRVMLPYASVWRRLGAIFLDGLLLGIPFIILIVVLAVSKGEEFATDPVASLLINLASLGIAILHFIYEGLMLSMKNGQTIGKNALGVRVVQADGSPLTGGQAWGRAALKLVFNNCLCGLHYLPAIFTAEKTALHDMIVNTRVVEA